MTPLKRERLPEEYASQDINNPIDDLVVVSLDAFNADKLNSLIDANDKLILAVYDATRGGLIDPVTVEDFRKSPDEVWHGGATLSDVYDESFLVYVDPYLNYRPTPKPGLEGALNWKISPYGFLLKLDALRQTGFRPAPYVSFFMVLADLGFYLVQRGAIIRQYTRLTLNPTRGEIHNPSSFDAACFIYRHYGMRALRYVIIRKMFLSFRFFREWKSYKKCLRTVYLVTKREGIQRQLGEMPPCKGVSVVLPTFGRYPYLEELLGDLRGQSVKPVQILVADGNQKSEENIKFYEAFADLPIEVLWMDKEGTCYTRNRCLERVTGDYVWIVDDDSRIGTDNLENHLRLIHTLQVDASVGPAYTKQRPELVNDQRYVRCTFFDCGTSVVRTSMLKKTGGFDMQYNNYLANEDGELGIRILEAGGIILNNPFAQRFHYLAPIGGARTSKNNNHRWRRWSFRPRPVQSIPYTGLCHYSRKATWEGTLKAGFLLGRKRKPASGGLGWETRFLLAEVLALPLSVYRLLKSFSIAHRMHRQGPQIPYFKFSNNQ